MWWIKNKEERMTSVANIVNVPKGIDDSRIVKLEKEIHELKIKDLESKHLGKTCFYILKNELMDFKIFDVDIFDGQEYAISAESYPYKGDYFDLLKRGYFEKDFVFRGICRINQSIIE